MLPQCSSNHSYYFFPPSEFIFITVDNWNIRSHWWLFYLPWISQIFLRSTFRLEKALWYCSKIKQRDFNVKSKVWHLIFTVVLSLNCQVVVWKTPRLKQPAFISQKDMAMWEEDQWMPEYEDIKTSGCHCQTDQTGPTWYLQTKQNKLYHATGDITGTVPWQKSSFTLYMVYFCGVKSAFETAGLYYQ